MKLFAVLALAATAMAAVTPNADPNNMEYECQPGTYSCTWDRKGWRVCDYSGHWVFGGSCSHDTVCRYNCQSQKPYCLAKPHHHHGHD
ncbi:hypothetical protein N658DRAFT_505934 [Parathielavia hyrcaniae]|uniref:Uncharacterized protein n=1 Tax=Parathielavia hyrcaniae TaxID=113614 RepID=A0AAN6Q8L1_9PEZI|nr:hypothetical protein N658DRAFT_505934 [Parathielavia hyrcaniae]